MGQKLNEDQKNRQRQAAENYANEQARIKQAAKAREKIQKSERDQLNKKVKGHNENTGSGSCEKDADGRFSSGNSCGSL